MTTLNRPLLLVTIPLLTVLLSSCSSQQGASDSNSTSSSATPEQLESALPASAPEASELLATLTPADSLMYTGNGSGALAGTRFSSKDAEIHCQLTPGSLGALCATKSEQSAWWPSDPDYDSKQGPPSSEVNSDLIGWSPELGTPFTAEPGLWNRTGAFPAIGTGTVLEPGQKLSVALTDGHELSCGAEEDYITCVLGDHGFSVSSSDFKLW